MIQINLIPETIVLRQACRRRAVFWLCANGLAALLVLAPVGLEGWQRAQAEDSRATLQATQRDRDRLKAELESLATASESVFLQLQRATALRAT